MMLIIIGNNNLVITSIIKLFYHNSRVSNIWDRPWHWKERSNETWKMSYIFFSRATNVSIDNRYWLACNSVSPLRVLGLFIIGFHSKYAIINIFIHFRIARQTSLDSVSSQTLQNTHIFNKTTQRWPLTSHFIKSFVHPSVRRSVGQLVCESKMETRTDTRPP